MANFKKLAYHKTSIEFENALDALYPQQADRVRSISVAYLEAYRPDLLSIYQAHITPFPREGAEQMHAHILYRGREVIAGVLEQYDLGNPSVKVQTLDYTIRAFLEIGRAVIGPGDDYEFIVERFL